MRRFSVFLAAAILCASMPTATFAEDVKVVVPEGTLVLTHLSEPMSSAKVHTGDLFQFVVKKDVIVNKLVAIRANSKGVGHVTEAHAAGSHGKAGGMRLAFDYIFAPDGSQIAVAHNKQAEEQDRSTLGATALGIILTGGLGLFFHNFVHGSDITIPDDAETYVTVISNRSVVLDSVKDLAPEPSASAAPIPSPSPVATKV
ncbi:MAG: hypothetical protein JWM53_3475 [bacterium]|nr:hypothetical protein [bacterium]